MSDNTLLVVFFVTIVGTGTLVQIMDKEPTKLVCNEPNVIAVEETSRGVVVRCGPVEVTP